MRLVRRLLLLLLVLTSLAFSGEAMAAEVLSQDDQGRTIHFDVQVEGVDAEWYAALLRAAPHGDEISTVTIEIVTWDNVHSTCGRDASGCYSRNEMIVPAEQSDSNAHTVVHEYGHHLDRSTSVAGVAEPNGTAQWWRARGMAELVRLRTVATSYALGWDRSIAEIFAEDYTQLALPGAEFGISWLEAPDDTVLAALKADFGLGPAPITVKPPAIKPVKLSRSGSLAPRRSTAIPFSLLGAEPPRHRDRELRWRRREARARNARGALQRQADRAQDTPTRKGGVRDRSGRPRPGRVHGDAHEHERVEQELQPGRPPLDPYRRLNR